jgi:hypothetical protein
MYKKTLNIFRPEIYADDTVMQFYTTPQLESCVLVTLDNTCLPALQLRSTMCKHGPYGKRIAHLRSTIEYTAD